MAVTQPAWPSRVPRRERVSDIFCFFVVVGGKGGGRSCKKKKRGGSDRERGERGRGFGERRNNKMHDPSVLVLFICRIRAPGRVGSEASLREGSAEGSAGPEEPSRGGLLAQRTTAASAATAAASRRRATERAVPAPPRAALSFATDNAKLIDQNPELPLPHRASREKGRKAKLALPFVWKIGRRRRLASTIAAESKFASLLSHARETKRPTSLRGEIERCELEGASKRENEEGTKRWRETGGSVPLRSRKSCERKKKREQSTAEKEKKLESTLSRRAPLVDTPLFSIATLTFGGAASLTPVRLSPFLAFRRVALGVLSSYCRAEVR